MIVVLCGGDLGRSPRMQYHALSLAKLGRQVTLVGYEGEDCCEAVAHIPQVRVTSPKTRFRPLKFVILFFRFLLTLLKLKPRIILVQSPPALPFLLVARLCARRVICDWHNLGFTLLEDAARRKGRRDPLVAVYRLLERLSGRLADAHICVTTPLADWLDGNFQVTAAVAPDRPPAFFKKARSQRGGGPLVVSSTSWSPDEDFNILVDALRLVKTPLRVVVTGKGPLQKAFLQRVEDAKLVHDVSCVFLPHSEYVNLLASADLGVCLHSSTSGLDLPMKVVDMFGAGLPVLALDFPTIPDLVVHGKNGLVFQADAASLAQSLEVAFRDYKNPNSTLATLRANVAMNETWDDMWDLKVKPVVLPYLEE